MSRKQKMPQKTILIADDDESVRGVVKYFLEAGFSEYTIEEFEDGKNLQNRLERELVSPTGVKLLITDNDMGEGPTGSEIIKKYADKPNISPIILYYGGVDNIGESAVQNGAFGYLKKPSKFAQFKLVVGEALKIEIDN